MAAVSRLFPTDPATQIRWQNQMRAPIEKAPEMSEERARDIEVIWKSIEASASKWRGTSEVHFPGMPLDRKEFWGAYCAKQPSGIHPMILEFAATTSGEGKVALDLGSGDSLAADLLLDLGWRVIAVDQSAEALVLLAKRNKEAYRSGQLKTAVQDIAEFTPASPVDLVIASDSLPYTDPMKFRATWQKIHDTCLKKDGFFIGSLFRQTDVAPTMNTFQEMGAWFLADRRMVRPLLAHAGYGVKQCKYRLFGEEAPMCIQFMAQKL